MHKKQRKNKMSELAGPTAQNASFLHSLTNTKNNNNAKNRPVGKQNTTLKTQKTG